MTSVSVSTVVCDGRPLAETLAMLADLGVRAVEPAYIQGYVEFTESSFSAAEASRLRHVAERVGVTFPALSGHCDLGRAEAPQMLQRRIVFAAELGARVLISNISTASRRAQARRTVDSMLPLLEQTGMVLALENPGHGNDEIAGTAAGLVDFVRLFDTPRLRANLDLCNIHTYSQGTADLEEALETCRGLLASIHLKEVRSAGSDWEFCAVGEGEAIGPRLLSRLVALEPAIRIGLELPLRLRRPGRGPPQRAPQPVAADRCAAAIATSMRAIADATSHRAGET
jgi:sugar phosphate isomerase/epimerase